MIFFFFFFFFFFHILFSFNQKFSLRLLLSFCLKFYRFQLGIAYQNGTRNCWKWNLGKKSCKNGVCNENDFLFSERRGIYLKEHNT